MVHRSDEQQHYFNTPFQLSIAPPGAEGAVLSDRYDVWPGLLYYHRGQPGRIVCFFPPQRSSRLIANHMQTQKKRRKEHFAKLV